MSITQTTAMKKTLLIVILSSLLYPALAQTAAKSIYAELGGPGLASFNFDTRFAKKEDGIGGRIGIGGFNIDGESLLAVPVGLTYLLGKDGKHYFELGGGFTYVKYKSDFYDDSGTFESSFGHLYFGYRVQPKEGGFLFRAAIVPIFNKDGFIPYYAGVSFGYKLNSNKKS
jgi:hypothetical protein